MIEYLYMEQGSPEWHEKRENKFSGSNAYKLLGSSGAHEWAKAKATGFKGNYWTRRGHLLESEAIELAEQILGIKIDVPGMIINSEFEHCIYSPDGIDVPLFEVKSFDIPQHLVLINSKTEDDIPLKIRAQIHYGKTISDKKDAFLIPYNPIFAKKFNPDGSPNDLYDPKKAFKLIPIKHNKNIVNNFKRILTA